MGDSFQWERTVCIDLVKEMVHVTPHLSFDAVAGYLD